MRGFCSTDRAQILRRVRSDFDLSTLKITALQLTQKSQKTIFENGDIQIFCVTQNVRGSMRGFCSTDRAQILRVVRFDFDLSTLKITALWLTQKWQKSAVENRGVVKPLKNRIFALGLFLIWKIIKRTPQGHYLGCFTMEKSRTHVFRRFSCNGTTPIYSPVF